MKTNASGAGLPKLNKSLLGKLVPKRGGRLSPVLAQGFLKLTGWHIVGSIPNINQAVLLAVPHTSNVDGVYALPAVMALDLDVKIMGKKSLFDVPVLSTFLQWMGVIPIDRDKKGSVLQTTIDRFKTGEPFFLGLAPEGTRGYTKQWKTGFYYIALEAGVPIIPVAMDYKSKQIRFMTPLTPTGDIEADLQKIYAQYRGVVPRHPENLSQILQDINKD
ncbi:lysophospholipid acyltransferase family protein [Psychrobacter sp. I-STPA6b]|uniref:lysophospholipid acyltransferase family protein n=1 Tax=Psychrobacter sp. I-STPA6b TaxID=2585718 RepID=UPI001D0CACAB|nr:lysophospholipid acyltransferase family protein [Psychrobacter sp. I-STPA6b]